MAGLGLQGGFGAGAASETLQDLLARRFFEQIQRQKLAQDQAEMEMRRSIADRQLSQGDRRIGLDERELGERGRQFDVTAGFKGREVGLEEQLQPVRIRQMGAQTADIERRPQAEAEDRAHDIAMVGTREASEGRLIGKRGAIDKEVAGIRAATTARPRIQQVIGVNAQGQPVTRIVNLDTQEVLAEFPRGLTPEEQVEQAANLTGARVGATIDTKQAKTPEHPLVKGMKWLTGTGQSEGGPVTITAPNGKTYSFASQAEADAFKRAAGIR